MDVPTAERNISQGGQGEDPPLANDIRTIGECSRSSTAPGITKERLHLNLCHSRHLSLVIDARIGAIVSFPGPGTPGPEPTCPHRRSIYIYIYSIFGGGPVDRGVAGRLGGDRSGRIGSGGPRTRQWHHCPDPGDETKRKTRSKIVS